MWLKCHLMEIKKNRSTYWNHGRLVPALSFASTILGFTVRGLLTSIKTWHYVTYQLCLEYYLVWICWTVMEHQWHRSCLIKTLLNDDVHWQNMFFTCKQCSICAGALKSNLLLILWPKLRHNVTKIQRTHQRFNMRLSVMSISLSQENDMIHKVTWLYSETWPFVLSLAVGIGAEHFKNALQSLQTLLKYQQYVYYWFCKYYYI